MKGNAVVLRNYIDALQTHTDNVLVANEDELGSVKQKEQIIYNTNG